jgi:hypothetical protein
MYSQNQSNEWRKNQIKFSPVRMINTLYPGLELSYEYQYGRLSSQISGAYLFDVFSNIKQYNSCKGYRFNFEEKYFFKKQPPYNVVKFYLSLEIGYNDIKINEDREFLPAEMEKRNFKSYEDEQYVYEDNFDLLRKSIITNFNFGLQIKIKRIILFDVSIGLGIILQNVVYSNMTNPGDRLFYRGPHGGLFSFLEEEGNNVVFNVPLSFKIGYAF